ncbi:histidyl-tRNA synthetase [Amycolatopsis xylanica]|uniref:Histidine--tRNA ligase n=1 Tax=Amycolatopsis xylanica TaxID=589385 RepID=A0A1H3M196_9PSEU|nr:histidine--tRNA ligase [Amycolatopsis xylanica]SDY70054.1 histidyl-tRNA synthetase [Amycolatopsis xylanica]
MPEFLSSEPYKGARDLLPAEASVRARVFGLLHDVVERYGYARYDGPSLEPVQLYERESDQQLFTLTDKGGNKLALRPELTPSMARAVAASAKSLQFPVRWYSQGTCFRYERPQRGRMREHWQLDVEIFGAAGVAREIEIFELIHDLLAALGATKDLFTIRVNDRNLLASALTDIVGISLPHLPLVLALIDRWEVTEQEKLAQAAEEIGLADKQFEKLSETLTAGPALFDELPDEVKAASTVGKVLDTGLVRYDPLIVRGLPYYTSTVFEVYDTSPENRRALLGGGAFDTLSHLFTEQPIPGFGFALGDVTLLDFLRTHDLLPQPRAEVDVVVVPVSEELADAARTVARKLRQAGLRTSTPLEPRKLGKELTRAEKAGARVVVIVGQEDWAAGTVTIRSMLTHEQRQVAVDAVAGAVKPLVTEA